jgi:hypothetical protein
MAPSCRTERTIGESTGWQCYAIPNVRSTSSSSRRLLLGAAAQQLGSVDAWLDRKRVDTIQQIVIRTNHDLATRRGQRCGRAGRRSFDPTMCPLICPTTSPTRRSAAHDAYTSAGHVGTVPIALRINVRTAAVAHLVAHPCRR